MKKRALLIGVNQYHLLGNLSYARQDAEAVAGALCKHCGFSSQDITLMTCQSEGASMGLSRYIEHALMNLTDEKDVDLLVFGFWGHGFAPVSGRRYLCGVDTAENDLERTAVSMDVVKAKLAQVQAENTLLILDCCQNRPSGRSASAEPMTQGEEATLASMARDIQAASKQQVHDSIPTVAILNACREGQKAYEWNQREHGIFTAHLLDAFEQGFTSIAPLSSWLFDRVAKTSRDLHQQSQTPYITIEGKGDIVIKFSSAGDIETFQQRRCVFAGKAEEKNNIAKPTMSLLEAVKSENIVEVRLNLEFGANVNEKDDAGRFPLFTATSKGNDQIVKILLKYGANVNAESENGLTSLHAAALNDNRGCLKLLLEHAGDLNQRAGASKSTPLHFAISQDNLQAAGILLDYGADVNRREGAGLTPLHMAINYHNNRFLDILLEHKADICATNEDGVTPLFATIIQENNQAASAVSSNRVS